MVEGLYSAAAGMTAQQVKLEAVGNDLANLSTTGYRGERVAFSDLLYSPLVMAGTKTTSGAGASATSLGRSGAQGAIVQTGRPLDVAIEGEGFLQVRTATGQRALTRDGALAVDANGSLTDGEGNLLQPPVKVPSGVAASSLHIAADGTVSAGGRTLGRLTLVTVPAPDRLLSAGGSRFTTTPASGEARPATGRIKQGAREQSDVDLGREMTDMVSTERSFQLDSSAIQTESQMMSIANQLRP